MDWFCTSVMTGCFLALGWNLGTSIFNYIRESIIEAPDTIREIKRLNNKNKKKNKNKNKKKPDDYYLD